MEDNFYYPGYGEAKRAVYNMSDDELLSHIDNLFGRNNLSDEFTHNELVAEAIEQTRKDFLTDYGRQQTKFLEGYAKAMKQQFSHL